MLLTDYPGFVLLGELILFFWITGLCLNDAEEKLGAGIALLVVAVLTPILLFADLTFKNVGTYLPYYGLGVLLWFFAKWFLTLWEIGAKIKQEDLSEDKLEYHRHISKDETGYHIVQPNFEYLFMHAILFPFSIIATFFDNILLRLFTLFKNSMQKFADSFLPKDLKVEKTK